MDSSIVKQSIDQLRSTLFYRAAQRKGPVRGFPKAPISNRTYIRITGGIGDLILGLGVAEAINDIVGDVSVYSKWPSIASFFSDLPQIPDQDLLENGGWDWYIIINSPVIFAFSDSFRGFRKEEMMKLFLRTREFSSKGEWKRIVDHHPLLDNVAGTEAVKLGLDRETLSYEFLGLKKRQLRLPRKTIESLRPNIFGRYITIHDGFDSNNTHVKSRATKTWSVPQWKKFCSVFKSAHPDIKIIQLGGPTSRIIKGVDVNFVAQIPFEKSMEILNNSLCHVDGDSGLVHAAHVLGVKSVVLFGPTPMDFFGYKDNVNIKDGDCHGCFWLKEDWMSNCPVGYELPECMQEIDPYTVFCEVNKVVKEKDNGSI